MFWVLWLPLAVFVGFVILAIYYAIEKYDMETITAVLGVGFMLAILLAFIGGFVNIFVQYGNTPKSVLPDTEHPVYLVPLLGDQDTSGKYLVALGGERNQSFSFYYHDPYTTELKTNVAFAENSPIVYDNPEKPYFLEYIKTCKNNFWALWCTDKNDLDIEFHLSEGMIVP